MRHVKLTHDNLGGGYQRALQIDGRKNQKQGGQGFRDSYLERVFAWAPPGFNPSRALVALMNTTFLRADLWSSGLVMISGEDTAYGKTTDAYVSVQGCRVLAMNAIRLTTVGYASELTHGPGARECRHYGGAIKYVNCSGSESNIIVPSSP